MIAGKRRTRQGMVDALSRLLRHKPSDSVSALATVHEGERLKLAISGSRLAVFDWTLTDDRIVWGGAREILPHRCDDEPGRAPDPPHVAQRTSEVMVTAVVRPSTASRNDRCNLVSRSWPRCGPPEPRVRPGRTPPNRLPSSPPRSPTSPPWKVKPPGPARAAGPRLRNSSYF